MNKEKLFRYFFIGGFLLLAFQALHILSPFFTGIFAAIILSLIFWPLHKVSTHLIGHEKPSIAAGATTAVLLVAIIIPFSLSAYLLYQEVLDASPAIGRIANTLQSWRDGESTSSNTFLSLIESKLQAAVKLSGVNFQTMVQETMNWATAFLISAGKALPRNAFSVFVNLIVMVTTLFFLFRDGPAFFKKLKDLTPMDEKHKDHIASQLYMTVTAVVRGVVIVAVVQGILATIGFALAGSRSPILLGFLTTLLAVVPMVGAGVVWVSVAIYYFIAGFYGQGTFIFLWGFFVVSLVDNFLRPVLIGGGTRIPFLAVFLGLVGGIQVYGPKGLFLGPLVVALILAFVRIYREEYANRIKKGDKPEPPEDTTK